jgi:type VI secretion system protein VasG
VFDKGWMEDGEGRLIDFKNTLILLTSNVGSELIASLCKDPELVPEPEAVAKALRTPLLKVFPPALLGRLVTVPYHPLDDQRLGDIARLQLDRIVRRVRENQGIELRYDDAVLKLVTSRCTELESGGRMIDAVLTNTLLPTMSQELLRRTLDGVPVRAISLSTAGGDFAYTFE